MTPDHGIERFTGLARLYDANRPDYPAEAIERILTVARVPHPQIVDVGSGTGIAARQLALRGASVRGIEPNEEMRAVANAIPLTGLGEAPTYYPGRAERTELPEQSCDLVVCAQAFHWVDPIPGLDEFRRILRPDGAVALMWNEPDPEDPTTHAYLDLIGAVSTEPERLLTPMYQAGEPLLSHPGFVDAEVVRFTHAQALTEDGLQGRALSVSHAPREPGAVAEFQQRLHELFQKFQVNGRLTLRYVTVVYLARRPSRPDPS